MHRGGGKAMTLVHEPPAGNGEIARRRESRRDTAGGDRPSRAGATPRGYPLRISMCALPRRVLIHSS